MNQARTRAMFAQLMDKFHWGPREIAALTDRQISDLCYHRRDTKGSILPEPEPPPTTTTATGRPKAVPPEMSLLYLKGQGIISEENYQDEMAKLKARTTS